MKIEIEKEGRTITIEFGSEPELNSVITAVQDILRMHYRDRMRGRSLNLSRDTSIEAQENAPYSQNVQSAVTTMRASYPSASVVSHEVEYIPELHNTGNLNPNYFEDGIHPSSSPQATIGW